MTFAESIVLLFAAGLAGQAAPSRGDEVGKWSVAGGSVSSEASGPGGAPRVVVTSVTVRSQAAPSPEAIGVALERGLTAGGLDVIAHRKVDGLLSRHPQLRGCRSAECRARLGRDLGALLCAEAELLADNVTMEVSVSILACGDSARVTSKSRSCRVGKEEAALDAVVSLAEAAASEASRTLARAAASGGSGVGVGGPDEEASTRARRRVLLWSGLSLAGAGLVAATAGAVLWGLDGRVYSREVGAERVYGTKTGGITATSLGLAALAGGIVMAVLVSRATPSVLSGGSPESSPAFWSLTLDPTRLFVGLVGSF
ncbi:MAG: hypothetical protein RBU30_10245 [Polyangia bacterium]|jgi:hypothetical protein|nr:hypothetical protein [Polyangia bacterium]